MSDSKKTDLTPKPISAASPHLTPPPWRLVQAEYPDAGGYVEPRVFSYADPDNPKIICSMAVRDGETELANGLMVAAAPDLYKALKDARYWIAGADAQHASHCAFICNNGGPCDCPVLIIDAALAKAVRP